jgi:CheY-like chemotaxis protein
MKILVIDDQQLVRLSVSRFLQNQGYKTTAVSDGYKALEMLRKECPDLIILDINMPGMNGLELIHRIHKVYSDSIPILILSGNISESIIAEAFHAGAADYMKKPLSLAELGARVARITGPPRQYGGSLSQNGTPTVQEHCVGVVIPCYNEAERIDPQPFLRFVDQNLGYRLCFVNDGSTDNTLELLKELQVGRESQISVYDCEVNGGKAEAVRQGMNFMAQDMQIDYVGFLDADLSTDFADFDILVNTLKDSRYSIVSGSRIHRMGADITKQSARAVISKTINWIIRKLLGMPFKDTQCGAKVVRREMVGALFQDTFVTRWLFDVELFMRIRNQYGIKKAQQMICEVPLRRWIHADGSKLSMKDSLKIGFQLCKIARTYANYSAKAGMDVSNETSAPTHPTKGQLFEPSEQVEELATV